MGGHSRKLICRKTIQAILLFITHEPLGGCATVERAQDPASLREALIDGRLGYAKFLRDFFDLEMQIQTQSLALGLGQPPIFFRAHGQ